MTAVTQSVAHAGQLESPTNQDLAAFHQAIGAAIPEVRAQAVPDASGLRSQLSTSLQDASLRLAEWQTGHAAAAPTTTPAPASDGVPSLTKVMQEAISGMQGAYAFAIEATLASHGSTELTKTLNTLLKGQ